MNNLIEYRKRVEELARARNGEPISNGSLEHAAVIVEQMFKSARKQVSILSSNLNARVYGRKEIVEQAKLFLAAGEHSAKILLESDDMLIFKDHPLFERLRNNDNLEVRIVPENIRQLYDYHYLVMDDDSYRFEPEKDGSTAVAAFGDKKNAEHLNDIFTSLWDRSTRVDLTTPEATLVVTAVAL